MTKESIIIFFGILLFHWIFDFVLQTDYQAKNKSRYTDALLGHTFIYSWSWICVLTGISITTNLINGTALDGSFFNALLFGSITCSAHTLTDFITSKSVKYYFDKKDYTNCYPKASAILSIARRMFTQKKWVAPEEALPTYLYEFKP